jgi:hypothetical protein
MVCDELDLVWTGVRRASSETISLLKEEEAVGADFLVSAMYAKLDPMKKPTPPFDSRTPRLSKNCFSPGLDSAA